MAKKKKAHATRVAWTAADVKKFKSMAGKFSTADIAKHFGRSPGAIAQKAGAEGVSLALKKKRK